MTTGIEPALEIGSRRGRRRATALALLLVVVLIVAVAVGAGDLLSLDELRARREWMEAWIADYPVLFTAAFVLGFILLAALAPGAAVFKVAAGAVFGLWGGFAVAWGSTAVAAVIGFLLSRYLARHWVEERFATQAAAINRGVEREGVAYLLAMRLNPLIPFFLINFGMGLTRMRLSAFAATSLLGLVPASLVYANAGTELARIDTPSDILSVRVLGSLVLLSLMPIVGRLAASWVRRRRGRATANGSGA